MISDLMLRIAQNQSLDSAELDELEVYFSRPFLTPVKELSGISGDLGKIVAGIIAVGDPPPESASSGTGIWIDSTGIYGLASDVALTTLSATTGALTATSATITGAITATSGAIAGWALTASSISSGDISLNSTAGSQGFYVGGSSGYLNGAGAFLGNDGGTYKFYVGNPAGGYMAWDGSTLKAAGWTIGATSLTDTAGVVGMSSAVTGGDDIRFFAGDAVPANAEFRLYESGALVATSATVTGAITANSGTLVNLDITGKLIMSGASSAIAIGATPPTSASAGTGLWLDRTGLYGLNSDVQQALFDAADGQIHAGAGAVTLDADGVKITVGTGVADTSAVKWYSGANHIGSVYTLNDAFGSSIYLASPVVAAQNSTAGVYAVAPTTYIGSTSVSAGSGTVNATIMLRSDDNDSTNTKITINSEGADVDTRIQGDNSANLLYCDAGLDAVQIGTTAAAGAIADFRAAGVVFNEASADQDFRVESNTYAYMLSLDAGNDTLGIGTTAGGEIALFSNTGIVFNEDSQDRDFRVESNGNANAFVIDGGNDTVQFLGGTALAALTHSTWTPTLTNVANAGTLTAYACYYQRVGAFVIFGGRFDVAATAASSTDTKVGISLPIASAFTQAYQAGGTFGGSVAAAADLGCTIYADATNDRLEARYLAQSTNGRAYYFHGFYIIL